MEKVAPNLKFVGHSTEIIGQSKIKGPLNELAFYQKFHFLHLAFCYEKAWFSEILPKTSFRKN